ncbi:MAG: tyrosine-protein phosphatase, partial [Synergistaceae bacterium]|nr:tyrosine-protein phosphatase [Synergistaceae bacterium]
TGCAAMLILSALGVDEDTIMADYVLTNTFNAKLIESERKMLEERGYRGEELEAIMKAMDEVDPQYMINALEWMKENYSSVAGYITQKLGVSESQIDALREKFLAK